MALARQAQRESLVLKATRAIKATLDLQAQQERTERRELTGFDSSALTSPTSLAGRRTSYGYRRTCEMANRFHALRDGALVSTTLRRYTGVNSDGMRWDPALPVAVSDPDASAFLTAAGIVDTTIMVAITQLVIDLKSDGIWSKLDAIYPIVGGSAFTHKWNLKDPRDLDGAFRLSLFGGWVHSSNGMMPSPAGLTYADTHYVASTHWSLTDGSLGYYSRTMDGGLDGPNYDMGCTTASDQYATIIVCHYWSGPTFLDFGTPSYPNVTIANGLGLFCTNQVGVTTKGYHNGVQIISVDNDATSQPPYSVYIGACNKVDVANYFSTKQCAFSYLGQGLSPAEQLALYARVQAFQTTLGRQV